MNKKILFLSLISCALLTSCAGEDTKETTGTPQPVQGKSVTFEVAPLSVETKSLSTKVNVKPTPTSDNLEWTEEQVSFLFYDNPDKQFESTFSVKPGLMGGATLTGDRPATQGAYHVIALSPKGDYFKDTSFESILSIPNPQTQNGSTYGHLTDYMYLYSNSVELLNVQANGDLSGSFPLQFNPLNSLVRFDIVNESSKRVTLNSITIQLGGSGVLYTSAKLHEGQGTLDYSGIVTTMTLDLSDAWINGGVTTPFSAYMAAWESGASGNLEIHLNITPDGESPRSVIYDLNNVLFESGQRTHIELNVTEGDVLHNIHDDINEEIINSYSYYTYTFTPPSGQSITWMMTNYNNHLPNNGYDIRSVTCPSQWSSPSVVNVTDLRDQLNKFPALVDEFKNKTIGPPYYYKLYASSAYIAESANGRLYITSNELTVPSGNIYQSVTLIANNSAGSTMYLTPFAVQNSIGYYTIFPVRCVKIN